MDSTGKSLMVPVTTTTIASIYINSLFSILDFNEARDDGVAVASVGPFCRSLAPCSQTDIHASTSSLSFYRPGALPYTQSTTSKY